MRFAIVICTLIAVPLLGLVTFVQILYLESLRLRPRDLPSLRFFKESLEERMGLKTEDGAGAFTLIKHSLLALLGVLVLAWFTEGERWDWTVVAEAAVAVWLIMFVVSYVLPQILYRGTEGRWLPPFAPLMRALALLVRPFTAILAFLQSLVSLSDNHNGAAETPTQAENIEALISAGAEEGLIEEQDKELIQSVVEFGDTVVREVMTARPNMVAISADSPLEELRRLVINEQYSRIPVYERTIDEICGFVHVRDMFELDKEERVRRLVRDLMRPVRFVPETKRVRDLMRQMQQENAHMVIVVDEYGNTAGLATMEDLLEVIIGEIRDEHEPDSDVVDDGKGGYIVGGAFDVARIGDLMPGFHPGDEIESTTVGGLVSEWLGRVPRQGEMVERNGIRVEILASDELRVGQVRISRSQAVAHE
jgi:CBS domain containing-hemolysin-like protein